MCFTIFRVFLFTFTSIYWHVLFHLCICRCVRCKSCHFPNGKPDFTFVERLWKGEKCILKFFKFTFTFWGFYTPKLLVGYEAHRSGGRRINFDHHNRHAPKFRHTGVFVFLLPQRLIVFQSLHFIHLYTGSPCIFVLFHSCNVVSYVGALTKKAVIYMCNFQN